jgi:hypothetical protein
LCRWSTRHGDLQWSSNCTTPIFLSFLKGQFSNDSLYSYQKKTLFVRLAMQSPICFSGLVQVCYSQILIYPLPNIIRWGCNHPNWGLAGEVPGMKTFTVWEALWTYRASTHHLHPSSVSSEEALDSALWVQECRKQRWIYRIARTMSSQMLWSLIPAVWYPGQLSQKLPSLRHGPYKSCSRMQGLQSECPCSVMWCAWS